MTELLQKNYPGIFKFPVSCFFLSFSFAEVKVKGVFRRAHETDDVTTLKFDMSGVVLSLASNRQSQLALPAFKVQRILGRLLLKLNVTFIINIIPTIDYC